MFYVYRLYDLSGETLYIGKGSGTRLQVQKRRFGALGEIVKTFKSERAAYREEVRQIAVHRPRLNQNRGGGGGIYGQQNANQKYDATDVLIQVLARMFYCKSRTGKWMLFGSDKVDDAWVGDMLARIFDKLGFDNVKHRLREYNVDLIDKPVGNSAKTAWSGVLSLPA